MSLDQQQQQQSLGYFITSPCCTVLTTPTILWQCVQPAKADVPDDVAPAVMQPQRQ
jgi:hypothetical protein